MDSVQPPTRAGHRGSGEDAGCAGEQAGPTEWMELETDEQQCSQSQAQRHSVVSVRRKTWGRWYCKVWVKFEIVTCIAVFFVSNSSCQEDSI